jgi:hypothetical protein
LVPNPAPEMPISCPDGAPLPLICPRIALHVVLCTKGDVIAGLFGNEWAEAHFLTATARNIKMAEYRARSVG